jgi:hypothetical protein
MGGVSLKNNCSGHRVQEIHEGYHHGFRHLPARTIGAGGDRIRATASFLNPRHLSSNQKKPLPAAAAAPAGEAPPLDCRFSQLDFRCAVE